MLDREKLLEQLDIRAVVHGLNIHTTRDAGTKLHGHCPLHEDKDPSWWIDTESGGSLRKGSWRCAAGCGSGSIFDLMIRLGLAKDFLGAAEVLGDVPESARKATPQEVKTQERAPVRYSEEQIESWNSALLQDEELCALLEKTRGLTEESIKKFELGVKFTLATKYLTVPLHEPRGSILQIRVGEGSGPKVVNPSGVPATFIPRPSSIGEVFLIESQLDAFMLKGQGINATSRGGTSGFSLKSIQSLLEHDKNRRIYVMPDRDDEGAKASLQLMKACRENKIEIFVLPYSSQCPGKDIGDYCKAKGLQKTLTYFHQHMLSRRISSSDSLSLVQGGKTLDSLVTILGEIDYCKDKLWLNLMGDIPMYGDKRLNDYHILHIRAFVETEIGVTAADRIESAVQRFTYDHAKHPVRCWLDSLKWDGKPRIEEMIGTLIQVAPKQDIELKQIFMRKWMISAVARAFEPGCDVHSMLVLCSLAQGIGKSMFLRSLGGDYYIDHPLNPDDKDSIISVQSYWIVELSELDGITRRADKSRLRAFISRNFDDVRRPFGRLYQKVNRGYVFAATTNQLSMIDGEDGRRYWPIEVQWIDFEGVRAIADQLWAEAVLLFRDEEPWFLDQEENARRLATAEDRFRGDDPVVEVLRDYLQRRTTEVDFDWSSLTAALKEAGIRFSQASVGQQFRAVGLTPRRSGGKRWWTRS